MKFFFSTSPSTLFGATIDPRVSLVITLFCVFAIAGSVRLVTLIAYFIFTLFMTIATQRLDKGCFKKMLVLNGFMISLFLLLPLFSEGKVVFTFLMLDFRYDGLVKALVIALRGNIIFLLIHIWVIKIPLSQLGGACQRLGVPTKLVQSFLFMIRYIDSIDQEYQRLITAMKLRGFRAGYNYLTFKAYGYLVGVLFVRTLNRAERILEAMKCRGFVGRFRVMADFKITRADYLFMLVALVAVVPLFYWEFFFYG